MTAGAAVPKKKAAAKKPAAKKGKPQMEARIVGKGKKAHVVLVPKEQ